MASNSLLLFTATTALSCFAPGPAALFVASNVAVNGKRHIPACAAGIASANLLYFLAAAMGIASFLMTSPRLFALLKFAGATYLVWLGCSLLLTRQNPMHDTLEQKHSTPVASFLNGLLIELSNPKALLYFGALLPQFIDTTRPLSEQILVFSFVTATLDGIAYSFYGMTGVLLSRNIALFKPITRGAGLLFLVVGVHMTLRQ